MAIDNLVRIMSIGEKSVESIRSVLSDLNTDSRIINYRLDVLEDFMNVSHLEGEIIGILQKISGLEDCNRIEDTGGSIFKAVSRIKELDIYSECLRHFKAFLEKWREQGTGRDEYRSLSLIYEEGNESCNDVY